MKRVMNQIESDHSETLEEIFSESDQHGKEKGRLLREIWEIDKKDKLDFWKDQATASKYKFIMFH